MDQKRQGEIITHLFEMMFSSRMKKRGKEFEKLLSKISKKTGVSVDELKKFVQPFAQKAFDEFFQE
mgnify:CR=1 FL=1